MLLCVDVGNTEIALGLYADGDEDEARPPLVRDWRMHTEPRMTADELEVADRRDARPPRTPSRSPGSRRSRRCRACCASSSCCVERRRRAVGGRRARRAHRGAAAGGQPARGRRRPGRQHPRRAPALRHGRASSSTSARPPTSTSSRPRASSSAARSPPASRSPWTALATRGGARCARSSWWRPRSVIGKNTVECLQSGRALRLRRAGRRAGAPHPRRAGHRPGHRDRHGRARPVDRRRVARRSPSTCPT